MVPPLGPILISENVLKSVTSVLENVEIDRSLGSKEQEQEQQQQQEFA